MPLELQKLTGTQQIGLVVLQTTGVVRDTGGINAAAQFRLLEGDGILDAEQQAAQEHVRVLGIRLHLQGIHQDVHEPRLQLNEGEHSGKVECKALASV